MTNQIKELADREADLLSRGRPLASMANLRKRISSLFLQFVTDHNFNPRAADFVLDPQVIAAAAANGTSN